ncbi:hypothetical protein UP10_32995 [Bradyrhizobium sp. LTSPM299]|uniref:hypothetical protein n=1 Tax=Bradyrhizobium sp. LTSPM299 TaxID=1619233 RepID=UPI0005C84AF4|nr:hypothetical protein [Bradyrhizobium sp. LTSPM299]KJC56757.1 hypothetical protein UP10_32995 [Bradyrhizobium sp. LTSPM299]
MHFIVRLALVLSPILILSHANAASPEDRYIATRDAAIAKFAKLKVDDAADKAEAGAREDLKAQMAAMLAEPARAGFAPAQINLDTLYKGDQGFGMLDGLRFDADAGLDGGKIGDKRPDGSFVEPKAHIVVTTESLFTRWLREHKAWWDKGSKNVPQQIDAALKFEGLYTQAISTDAAVINFNELPIAKPASVASVYGFLAGRSQDETPDKADEVFVTALANGKVYVAYGEITPAVQVPACTTIRADINKRAEEAEEKFRQKKIDKKAYDKLGNLREQADGAFKRCFVQHAPEQPAFAQAAKQAQALLETALGK